MFNLNELQNRRFLIVDNGNKYFPDTISLLLNGAKDYGKTEIIALFNQEDAPDDVKEVGKLTLHNPPMYQVYFNINSEDDRVKIIELEKYVIE